MEKQCTWNFSTEIQKKSSSVPFFSPKVFNVKPVPTPLGIFEFSVILLGITISAMVTVVISEDDEDNGANVAVAAAKH
ncbi:hypothetical protein NQ315_007902 [Exocentrus adspersus]|uniref:Transmembrane protein n=1 Tax=Exocentrus adspersus TaxID=1586481 RepID=A0AAV8W9K9_9CUCU|nr:hypothetical protein NQ315_007902 [Exocentrus adspersus]